MGRHARSKRLREDSIEVGGSGLGFDANILGLLRFHDLVIEKVERSLVDRHGSGFEPKLQLGLCRTIELLVDRRVRTIEGDVSAGRVGIALEENLSVRRNGKKDAQL